MKEAAAEEIRAAARLMGRRGGSARARKLTPARRREIARAGAAASHAARSAQERVEIGRRAARARWNGLRAMNRIGENARRVLMIDYLRANATLL